MSSSSVGLTGVLSQWCYQCYLKPALQKKLGRLQRLQPFKIHGYLRGRQRVQIDILELCCGETWLGDISASAASILSVSVLICLSKTKTFDFYGHEVQKIISVVSLQKAAVRLSETILNLMTSDEWMTPLAELLLTSTALIIYYTFLVSLNIHVLHSNPKILWCD